MRKKYETLDEYLDDLDEMKEQAAAKVEGMDPEERIAYINQSRKRLERKLKAVLRPRKTRRRAASKR